MFNYTYLFALGIGTTIISWLCTGLISFPIGFLLGTLSSKYSSLSLIKRIIKMYVFIARGIPVYVQILIAYFIIPSLIGINIPAFIAACGALSFCSIGYVTEIVRAGINSVPQGQWDACKVLDYSPFQAFTRIILPQALRAGLPSLCGEAEQLVKSTALFATIGITELTRTGMNIISRELNPIPVYLTIALLYLCFSLIIHIAASILEKRLAYD